MKKNNTYQIISIVLLIVTISFGILYFTKSSLIQKVDETTCAPFVKQCPIEPEEQAMIFGFLNSWGENTYDSSEYLIGVDIFNFGLAEAKNVEVSCEVTVGDEDGYEISEIPVSVISKRIGNIASNSYKYVELELEKDLQKEGNYPLASCLVSYCENCEILGKTIPELN